MFLHVFVCMLNHVDLAFSNLRKSLIQMDSLLYLWAVKMRVSSSFQLRVASELSKMRDSTGPSWSQNQKGKSAGHLYIFGGLKSILVGDDWNMNLILPFSWEWTVIIPIDELIFFRGVGCQPPTNILLCVSSLPLQVRASVSSPWPRHAISKSVMDHGYTMGEVGMLLGC